MSEEQVKAEEPVAADVAVESSDAVESKIESVSQIDEKAAAGTSTASANVNSLGDLPKVEGMSEDDVQALLSRAAKQGG